MDRCCHLGKWSQVFKPYPQPVYSSVRRNFIKSETCAAVRGGVRPHIRLVEANVSDKTNERERLMIFSPGSSGDSTLNGLHLFIYLPLLEQTIPRSQHLSLLCKHFPQLAATSSPHQLSVRTKTETPSCSRMIFNATISSWDGTPLTPLEPHTQNFQFTQQSQFHETIKTTRTTHSPKSQSDSLASSTSPPQLYCDYRPLPRSKPNLCFSPSTSIPVKKPKSPLKRPPHQNST
jgi:hypothetical protein